jgi:hypothetical protein
VYLCCLTTGLDEGREDDQGEETMPIYVLEDVSVGQRILYPLAKGWVGVGLISVEAAGALIRTFAPDTPLNMDAPDKYVRLARERRERDLIRYWQPQLAVVISVDEDQGLALAVYYRDGIFQLVQFAGLLIIP